MSRIQRSSGGNMHWTGFFLDMGRFWFSSRTGWP